MSKTTDHIINTAADRADQLLDEATWLRHEVTRLGGIITQAALLLDEGGMPEVLERLESDLRDARYDADARDVAEIAATLRRVQAMLKA